MKDINDYWNFVKMSKTFKHFVVHKNKSSYDILIDRTTKWGNPFIIGKDGTREEVIEKYKNYILTNTEMIQQIKTELKGKILGCWCSPLACHGDILAEIANDPLDIFNDYMV